MTKTVLKLAASLLLFIGMLTGLVYWAATSPPSVAPSPAAEAWRAP